MHSAAPTDALDDPSVKDADEVSRALGADLERGFVLWVSELRKLAVRALRPVPASA